MPSSWRQAAKRRQKKVSKKSKADKPVKDANKPKAPAGGGYGVFVAENRAKILASLPKDAKITDVSKAAGVQWKALPEKDRLPYETTYKKKREEYTAAMEKYTPPPAPVAQVSEKDTSVFFDGVFAENKQMPAKKRAAPENATESVAKKGKVAKKNDAAGVEIEAKVLKEAEGLKLVAQIRNLAARPDVMKSGKSQKEMLEALRKNDGLVNKAKTALLGA